MATITERPTAPPSSDQRAGGDRFVGAGLLLLAALFVGVQMLAGELIPPLAVPALIYLALGVATLLRRSRWLLLTAAVLVLIHLLTSIQFLAAALAHPESPASFLPDAFISITALSVVAAAIAALRGAGPGTRRSIPIVAGVLAALAVVVAVVASSGVESAEPQPADVAVQVQHTQFPAQVAVTAGGGVLWVDNRDPFRHTLVVEGTDVHAELPGSTAVRIDTDLEPGTYRYFCDVPGHDQMEGELVVR